MTEREILDIVATLNEAKKELFSPDDWQTEACNLALAALLESVGQMKYVPGRGWLYGKERVAAHAVMTKGGE